MAKNKSFPKNSFRSSVRYPKSTPSTNVKVSNGRALVTFSIIKITHRSTSRGRIGRG